MKILNVYGSMVDGSSAAIATRFLEKAGLLCAQIESFTLGGLQINGCKRCLSCKTTTDRCAIRDDITTIFDILVTCDVLVLSTGVYEGDVTGNLYLFESRLFSFLKPDFETRPDPSRLPPPPRKILVFIQTQGGVKEWHADIYQRYESLFWRLGFGEVFVIQADCVDHPYDIGDDVMNRAEEIAASVIELAN